MRYLVALVLWCTSLSAFTTLGLIYALTSFAISPRKLQPLTKWVCRFLLLCAGQRLVVKGQFPAISDGPFIYMFNHASLLDTFIILSALPEHAGAVGKKAQFEMPIWGWILRRWGAISIDRSQLNKAIESLNVVEADLMTGLSLLISPEGTRSKDGRLAHFKKGPFHIAANTNATIVPLGIEGAYEAKNKGSWVLRPGTIQLHIGETISRGEGVDYQMENLRRLTRDRIAQLLPKERDDQCV